MYRGYERVSAFIPVPSAAQKEEEEQEEPSDEAVAKEDLLTALVQMKVLHRFRSVASSESLSLFFFSQKALEFL